MPYRILIEDKSSSTDRGEFVTVVRCQFTSYSIFKATDTHSPRWLSKTFTLKDDDSVDASKTVWRIRAERGEDGKSLKVGPVLVKCLNADDTAAAAPYCEKLFSFGVHLMKRLHGRKRLPQPAVAPKVCCFEEGMWHTGTFEDLCAQEEKIVEGDFVRFDVSLWMPMLAATVMNERRQLSGDFSNLLTSDHFSDVTLVADDGRRFPLHRNILSTRSPVFAAMFDADMIEKTQKQVPIRGVNGNVLDVMVKYIYSGCEATSLETASSVELEAVLAVADQYSLEVLKSECESRLLRCLDVERVREILVLADLHNCVRLRDAAVRLIGSGRGEVFKTEGWNKIIKGATALLSQRPDRTSDHVTRATDDNEADDDGEPPNKAKRLDSKRFVSVRK